MGQTPNVRLRPRPWPATAPRKSFKSLTSRINSRRIIFMEAFDKFVVVRYTSIRVHTVSKNIPEFRWIERERVAERDLRSEERTTLVVEVVRENFVIRSLSKTKKKKKKPQVAQSWKIVSRSRSPSNVGCWGNSSNLLERLGQIADEPNNFLFLSKNRAYTARRYF